MPILAIGSLTRILQSTGKWVFHDGMDKHKHDSRTSRLRDWIGPEGQLSGNQESKQIIWNMSQSVVVWISHSILAVGMTPTYDLYACSKYNSAPVSFIGGNSRFLSKLHFVWPVNTAVAVSSDSPTHTCFQSLDILCSTSVLTIGLLCRVLSRSRQWRLCGDSCGQLENRAIYWNCYTWDMRHGASAKLEARDMGPVLSCTPGKHSISQIQFCTVLLYITALVS